MLFLKTFKDAKFIIIIIIKGIYIAQVRKGHKCAKFVVDGNAFQTFITLSTKKFWLMLAVQLGLNSLYLWPLVLVLVLSAKKSSKFTFTEPNTIL